MGAFKLASPIIFFIGIYKILVDKLVYNLAEYSIVKILTP